MNARPPSRLRALAAALLLAAGVRAAPAQEPASDPGENGAYREKYAALAQENEYLRRRLAEIEQGAGDETEAENVQLRAEIEDLKGRLRKAKEDTDELCRLVEEGKEDAQGRAELTSRIAVLEGENAALKAALGEADAQKERADKAEAELAAAKKQMEQPAAKPVEAPAAPGPEPAAAPASSAPAAPVESAAMPKASDIFDPVPLERVGAPGTPLAMEPALLALFRAGVTEEQGGRYEAALTAYEEAASKAPANLDVVKARGRCLLNLGRAKDALDLLGPAAARAPQDMQVQLLYGIALSSGRKFREAVDALKPVVVADLSDARARAALGSAWLGLGAFKAARLEIEKALELDPQLTDAHLDYARVLMEGPPSEREQARVHYQAALQLGAAPDPDLEKRLRGVDPASAFQRAQ